MRKIRKEFLTADSHATAGRQWMARMVTGKATRSAFGSDTPPLRHGRLGSIAVTFLVQDRQPVFRSVGRRAARPSMAL